MATCKGSNSTPLTLESQLLCPVCLGEAPMDRFRLSATEVGWSVAIHEPITGLRYRCITCLQPQKSFGQPTVCTAASGHQLAVYPFKCQACKGSVRVLGGKTVGYCTESWGGKHQLDTAVSTQSSIVAAHTPTPKPYREAGRFNVKSGRRCSDCKAKLTFRDGMTKCQYCLYQEALHRG